VALWNPGPTDFSIRIWRDPADRTSTSPLCLVDAINVADPGLVAVEALAVAALAKAVLVAARLAKAGLAAAAPTIAAPVTSAPSTRPFPVPLLTVHMR
jgi:hypothetical protein